MVPCRTYLARCFALRRWGWLALLSCVIFSACDPRDKGPQGAEIDDPNYRLGQRLVKQGRSQEALAAYLRVIAARGEAAPESHLEVGIIYLQQIKDPIAAIYHFRKYLERNPNSPQAPQVRGLVEGAKREFARTLPANPLENQSERLDMVEQISRLQRENDQLKAELLSAARHAATQPPALTQVRVPTNGVLLVPSRDAERDRLRESPPPPSQQQVRGTARQPQVVAVNTREPSPLSLAPVQSAQASAAPVVRAPTRPGAAATANANAARRVAAAEGAPVATRRHVVARGDTLFGLAQRYYNDRTRWREIYNANRDVLPNENSLAVGMELRIPQ